MASDNIARALALKDKDNNQGIFCGYVTNGGSFPTARPDGSPLKSEDFVRPLRSSTFPFSIGDVEFTNRLNKAFYFNNKWELDPGAIQDTSETPTIIPVTESLSGESINQKQVNVENREAISELQKLHKPKMTIEVSPDTIFEKGLTISVTISYSVQRVAANIKKISLYKGAIMLQNQTVNVKDGGSYIFTDTISEDASYHIEVVDVYDCVYKSDITDIVFVYPCYYGYASNLDGITKILPLSKTQNVEVVYNCTYDKPVFKYNKNLGELTSILTASDGNYYENYLSSFDKNVTDDSIIYTLKDACYLDNYKFKFVKQ